ncbi:hypothetical protein V8F20_007562 [Naviculisporaceae sp. PSN 640]
MTATRPSLKAFLATAKKALASPPPAQTTTPLTFVLGNESADLDSLCSAVLLAYFRSQIPPHTLHIPLSNLPRADLALRPELTAVLRPAGLSNDDLLTLSDLPSAGVLQPSNTRWLLVDHNAPTGDLASQLMPAKDSLIGCIDHHADEGKIPPDASPRVIEKSGSCMSLVVNHYKSTWQNLSSQAPSDLDAQLAHLALGPILIDTTNLTSKDKTTPFDISAVEFAESFLSSSSTPTIKALSSTDGPTPDPQETKKYTRSAFFNNLTTLKESIKSLSYRDLLRKDYKQWTETEGHRSLTLGTAVIMRNFSYLLAEIGPKEEFFSAIKSYSSEQKLDMIAVMTVSHENGEFMRELLVWAFTDGAVKVAKQFVEDFGTKLGLEKWNSGSGELDLDDSQGSEGWRMAWRQRGVESSRKQVAPMLRDAIKKVGSKL